MTNASGGQLISLPQGGGAMQGMGEKFSPDLHTGTGNFTVPIALPPGRNGFQPKLDLVYSTGVGNGLIGLGRDFGIPGVSRTTSKGVPLYRDAASDQADRDVFILSGAEDLVPIGSVLDEVGRAAIRYRPRTEGLFAEILHYPAAPGAGDHWRVRSKDGLVSYYGPPTASDPHPQSDGESLLLKPDKSAVFAWKLSLTTDPFGNRIEYLYDNDEGVDGPHRWRKPLLKTIRYADYGDPQAPKFLVTVSFTYEARTDAFSDYRAGFEIRTTQRCASILIETHADRDRKVRRYDFAYGSSGPNQLSVLSRIDVVGFDDSGAEAHELPPLEFGYTEFHPEDRNHRNFFPLQGEMPTTSLANKTGELVDVFGNGLPSFLELNGTARFWRNVGGGRFAPAYDMDKAPSGFTLADAGVQLIDADGDGRSDLMVTRPGIAGYFPLRYGGGWDRHSMRKYAVAPSVGLQDPEVRLMDLTGDGVTDAIRSGARIECYFNDPEKGWRRTRRIERKPAAEFPDVVFSDPRVKLGDMTGDGLQDIVLVNGRSVAYWPNRGHGDWGGRVVMRNAPRLPLHWDPKRLLIGDVDGDGLADLIYVDDRLVRLWVNQSGNAWSDEIPIHGTPPLTDADDVRLVDLLGSGVSGVLWTRPADRARQDHCFFLDLTGGAKPYLLSKMNNNMGAVTGVSYAPSTHFYLEDEKQLATRWRTPLPFPVQVVKHVEVTDALSGGRLTTEYAYHDGYWDGFEREFRGFGLVEQFDTEIFARGEAAPGAPARLAALAGLASFSPPTLQKTWFHQGAVGDDDGDWRDEDRSDQYWPGDIDVFDRRSNTNAFLSTLTDRRAQRDALRALRGSVIRTEFYALDGTLREDRPYTVTETAYAVSEVEQPAAGENRHSIFFPHVTAQRTTQWERGDDPMTSFVFTSDYDPFGQPRRQLQIACPRGWRHMSDAPADIYLGTMTRTEYATPDDPGAAYIHDRPARVTRSEPLNTHGLTLRQIKARADADLGLATFAQSQNYYDRDPAAPGFGAFVGLPPGRVGKFGALVRSEDLVLTDDIVARAYESQPPAFLNATVAGGAYPAGFASAIRAPRGGYNHRAGGYFVTSTARRFDFHAAGGRGRGLLAAQRDPMGAETQVAYDQPYQLLPVGVTDAAGMTTQADYNYRVLQPRTVTDPNLNRTEFTFTPAGLLEETWVMGKATRTEGDRTSPSVRMEYGLRAFFESTRNDPERPQPVCVSTVRRVRHDADPENADETIETREYSDGFGRLLQIRTQGEALRFGDALLGGGNAVLPAAFGAAGASVIGRVNADPSNPNVIVNGWQTYDNKGRVVEKYEPFFATGWDYEQPGAADLGQCRKATIQYDPRGHAVRATNPDGSQQRVIFGMPADLTRPDDFAPTPWESTTYDANDNAGRTHPTRSAPYKMHWNTPSTARVDALGRTIEVTERLGLAGQHRTRTVYDIQGNVIAVIDALGRKAFRYVHDLAKRTLRTESLDAGLRLAAYDAAGAVLEQHDRKGALILLAYDVLGRPRAVWARDGTGQPMGKRQAYVYGDDPELALTTDQRRERNVLGRLTEQRDDAGVAVFARYDFKGAVLLKSRQAIADAVLLAVHANPAPNGEITPFRINWDAPPTAPFLEAALETSFAYDALGRIVRVDAPAISFSAIRRIRPSYNKAGALEHVEVEDPASGTRQTFVEHIAYNAKGQRVLIAYGNHVLTRYAYDTNTFRLVRLRSERFTRPDDKTFSPAGGLLQELGYTYDLAGNILSITDRTPGCGVVNNPDSADLQFDAAMRVSLAAGDVLVRRFTYDPLYRLLSATGREAKSLMAGRTIPESRDWFGFGSGNLGSANQDNAPNQTALYLESYTYDAVGNITTLSHHVGGPKWARYFGMDSYRPQDWAAIWPSKRDATTEWSSPPSNQLTNFGAQADAGPTQAYDANGNLVSETTSRHFEWDYADRLRVFRVQPDGAAPSIHAQYLYDAAGQRVKKLVRDSQGGWESTLYVDELIEVQRVSDANGLVETTELHVMNGQDRVAVVRLGPALPSDGAAAHAVKFYLADHLGSSAIVVSADGGWINREEYFPYGECSLGSYRRKRYRFTGMERDEESGLGYHGRRYYAPNCARWIQVDPLAVYRNESSRRDEGRAEAPVNCYAYGRQSPTRFIDPKGLQEEEMRAVTESINNLSRLLSDPDGSVGHAITQASQYAALAEAQGAKIFSDEGTVYNHLANVRQSAQALQNALGQVRGALTDLSAVDSKAAKEVEEAVHDLTMTTTRYIDTLEQTAQRAEELQQHYGNRLEDVMIATRDRTTTLQERLIGSGRDVIPETLAERPAWKEYQRLLQDLPRTVGQVAATAAIGIRLYAVAIQRALASAASSLSRYAAQLGAAIGEVGEFIESLVPIFVLPYIFPRKEESGLHAA
jgi:RHS repeat-associated protein